MQCTLCKQEKPSTEYYRNKTKTSGLDSMCKACRKITNAQRKSTQPKLKTTKERLRDGYKITRAYYSALCLNLDVDARHLLLNSKCSSPGCNRAAVTYSFGSYKSYWRHPNRIADITYTHCAKHNKSFTKLRNMNLKGVLD